VVDVTRASDQVNEQVADSVEAVVECVNVSRERAREAGTIIARIATDISSVAENLRDVLSQFSFEHADKASLDLEIFLPFENLEQFSARTDSIKGLFMANSLAKNILYIQTVYFKHVKYHARFAAIECSFSHHAQKVRALNTTGYRNYGGDIEHVAGNKMSTLILHQRKFGVCWTNYYKFIN